MRLPDRIIDPGNAEVYNDLGVALGENGDFVSAIDRFEQALNIRPDFARAWNNLGVALKGLGQVPSAIDKFRRAIQIDPDYVEAHWNLSFLLLLTGVFKEGWKEYEWRFRKKEWARHQRQFMGGVQWDGSRFSGKRLLVYDEQGFGDALQFVRYLKMVKGMGGTVILETQRPLLNLFQTVSGVDELIERQTDAEAALAFDLHIPLLSLPRIFGTTVETIPSQGVVPYIHADPEKAQYWQRRLHENHFKIGLVWEGKPTDPNRACPLERLAPLARIEGIKLYGLQKGEAALQAEALPGGMMVTNLGDALNDFSDTAAIIANLDLVISVDTAVAHLSGAMGKPTFALLPFAPDWRWLMDRDDSPWYPSMRLFRQSARGGWDHVVERLIPEVSERVGFCFRREVLDIRSGQGETQAGSCGGGVNIKEAIGEAIRFHQSGQLQKSLDTCEQVCQQAPGNWEALHLLSVIYHQTGHTDRISDLIAETSSCKTKTDALFVSLGNLLKDLGHPDQALACYREALRLGPASCDLYYNIGNVLKQQGHLRDAIASYVQAIELKKDMFDAYYNMGNSFHALGELSKALACYTKALEIEPGHMAASHNASLTLKALGRSEDAIACYRNALRFHPDAAEIHYNMGNVYKEQGRFQNAISSYLKAIDLKPQMVEAHYNLGNALKESRDLDEAISCYERVLKMAPDHFGALNNMGLAYRDLGQIDRAVEMYDQALKLRPDHVEIRWNRALAVLLQGDLSQGWNEYEVRFQRDDLMTTYPRRFDKPVWNGSPFKGKTLLVHHEQGFGDTIQFVRYLPMVKARGGTVILEVHESLHHLCRDLPGVDQLISPPFTQELDVSFDHYIPLLSLPRIFNTTLETIPADIPYLYADHEIKESWRERLDGTHLAIGLVWAGNPGHKDDHNRSCPLDLFEPLSRIPGVTIYGLQKDGCDPSRPLLQSLGITNLGESLKDFSVTAGVIANLDLIISVDTAVAHLGGAMGKPVWLLLPFVPDWRWLMKGDDTPWYPTMRLYRQKRPGDWQEVIGRVTVGVRTMATGASIKSGRVPKLAAADEDRPVAGRIPVTSAFMVEGHPHDRSGDSERADEICGEVPKRIPTHSEALHVKGLIHHREGRYEKAVHLIGKAIEIDPQQPVFFNNLGAAYQERGDLKEAALCYQQAIQLKPDFAEAYNNLGKVFLKQKAFEEAVSWMEKAVHLKPEYMEAYVSMAEALMELGRPDQAIACGKHILRMDRSSADARIIVGNGLMEQDQFEAAISSYKDALNQNPRHVQALVHMGLAYQFLGQIDTAIETFDRALMIDKNHPDANLNRALACLLAGDYREGWKGYEWRMRMEDWKRRHPHRSDRPRWEGLSFKHKTVLVYHEQGLGDELQFVRFLPMVKARGGTVIFEANRRLLRLFRGLHGGEQWVLSTSGQYSETDVTFQIPLLSLPGLFGTTPETIPSNTPYLRPEQDLVDLCAHKLRNIPGFRIGISWQGNPSYRDDRHRSAPLKHFSSLAKMEGVTLVSLQKGYGLEQIEGLGDDVSIINLGPELDESPDAFVHTAAVMANLDLIVASDSAVPHLAGALGIPVWLLLPQIPDWRWGLSGEICPWYPTMRLFRQETRNDWPGVFQRVCQALLDRIRNRSSR
ncbi:MAG: tetratricopeptide repeat protein [Deltaproteobacteria bacterium]|nr:tetratricopeptide repeat protein [Deltaproteobacteria bacterium]